MWKTKLPNNALFGEGRGTPNIVLPFGPKSAR
jgi:hypothetical protein